jgi:hypothetical protein
VPNDIAIYQHVSLVQVKGLCVGLAGNFDVRSWPRFPFATALMLLLNVQCVAAQLEGVTDVREPEGQCDGGAPPE